MPKDGPDNLVEWLTANPPPEPPDVSDQPEFVQSLMRSQATMANGMYAMAKRISALDKEVKKHQRLLLSVERRMLALEKAPMN